MDEVMTAIAAALAGKAVDVTFEGGKKALAALKDLVRDRFRNDKQAQIALEAAQRDPDQTADLARAIEQACGADPAFAARLWGLWAQVAQVTNDSVTNTISGNVGKNAVQARDIHGDIHL